MRTIAATLLLLSTLAGHAQAFDRETLSPMSLAESQAPTNPTTGAQPPPQPAPKKSPIVMAWLLIYSHFPNIETIPADKTSDGSLSVILAAPKKPQYLSNLIIHYIREPERPRAERCATIATQPVEVFNNCCFNPPPSVGVAFTTDCLTNMKWEQLDAPLGRALLKIGFYLGTLHVLSAEIARNTRVVTKNGINNKEYPGNELMYLWSVNYDDAHDMITILDDEFIDRIATTIHMLLPRMYAAVGSPSAGPAPYYQCSQDGVIPVPKDWSPSGAPVLVISRGERVPILGPTGQAVHSSLVFYRESSGALYFALRPDPAPANTGPESSLMKFLASVPEGKEAFPCAPKGTTEAIKKHKNQFNQTSSSTFYFYLFYLDAAYEELMRVKDLAAKAPKEEIDVSGPLKGLIDMAGKFIPIPGIK